MTEKRVSVRLAVVGGTEMKTQLDEVGRSGQRAMREVGDGSARLASQVQNASYQVGDFAVQVAGGTDATRAFAQQLPQLLGGFGVFGAVLGAAAAILIPLGGYLISAGESSDSLSDSVDDLVSSSRALIKAQEEALTPIGDLQREFRDQARAARELYEAQRSLAELDFLDSLDAAREKMSGALEGITEQLDRIRASQPLDGVMMTPGSLAQIQSALGELESEFGITRDEAERLEAAITALDSAQGPVAIGQALQEIVAAIEATADESGKIDPALREVAKSAASTAIEAFRIGDGLGAAVGAASDLSAIDIASGITTAADEAVRLAENLYAAAGIKLSGPGLTEDDISLPKDILGQTTGTPIYEQGLYGSSLGLDLTAPAVRKSSAKGGGGGKSDAEKARETSLKDAKRWYEETRTAAEKLKLEEQDLKALYEGGYFGRGAEAADTYQRALENVREELGGLSPEARKGADAVGDLFASIMDGADGVRGALASILEQIAKVQLAKAGIGLLGAAGGGGFLSWLGDAMTMPSFDGGGSTPSGPRSGGIDGKGGFLAMLHPDETVVDHTKQPLRASSSAGSTSTKQSSDMKIEQHFNLSGGTESMRAMIRQEAPFFRQLAEATFADAIKRGRLRVS
ncbi:hypothetical protein V8J36_05290 [Frigidibacter sp. MR17.14]|uniref:hypothetical protein n=1 Tax=Frigidibacter sp. MR17.14 TaxID=3126509 RepID=UPI003012F37A